VTERTVYFMRCAPSRPRLGLVSEPPPADQRPNVRAATLADVPSLVRFNRAMARETEALTLDPTLLEAGVGAVLADSARGFYLVCELEGRMAGSLMVTPEWSDWRNAWIWWIQSVYVEPECRRRGVYRALHGAVVERAQQAGDVRGVRLYVERENHGAQDTYAALGMSRSRYDLFEVDL
jgi:GNAT superfamily N-acetyltransferase